MEDKLKLFDGYYTAQVGYYNFWTDYSSVYRLSVKVEDNRVVSINFNNGDDIEVSDSGCEGGELDVEVVSGYHGFNNKLSRQGTTTVCIRNKKFNIYCINLNHVN